MGQWLVDNSLWWQYVTITEGHMHFLNIALMYIHKTYCFLESEYSNFVDDLMVMDAIGTPGVSERYILVSTHTR